jgi:hypothetical protein
VTFFEPPQWLGLCFIEFNIEQLTHLTDRQTTPSNESSLVVERASPCPGGESRWHLEIHLAAALEAHPNAENDGLVGRELPWDLWIEDDKLLDGSRRAKLVIYPDR